MESPAFHPGTQPAQWGYSIRPAEAGQVGGPCRGPEVILRVCAQNAVRVGIASSWRPLPEPLGRERARGRFAVTVTEPWTLG